MKKELATNSTFRLYKRHRKLVEKLARKEGVSQSEIVRRAIEAYPGSLRSNLAALIAKEGKA